MNEDQKAKTLKRQMTYRAALKLRGGKVTTVYLSPESNKALKDISIMSNGAKDTEVINKALVVYWNLMVISQPL
jgi:hypothetical protein